MKNEWKNERLKNERQAFVFSLTNICVGVFFGYMKKYTLFLLAFVLGFLGLFNSNTNIASAANCAPGDLFNTATGQACNVIAVSAECKPGDLFNSTTGKPCSVVSADDGSGSSQDDSSDSVAKFNELFKSNFKIGTRGKDVKLLQQFLKDEGYYFGKVDGKYGRVTARAVKDFQEDNDIANVVTPTPIPPQPVPPIKDQSPIISGISGPQTLNVNQTGTWTVRTSGYSVTGGNLSYSVDWGDVSYIPEQFHVVTQQSATFTHSYSHAGTYAPQFTATNEKGQTAQTSITVKVGNTTTQPSITILSPNGGEVWAKGSTQTIKWQNNLFSPAVCLDTNCTQPAPKIYDITLQPYPSCAEGDICSSGTASRVIARKVNSSSYDWTIPNCYAGNECSSNVEIPAGSYKIQVCQTDTSTCDSSDQPFSIVAEATVPPPSIISPLPLTAKVLFASGVKAGERRREIFALDTDNGNITRITTSNKHHIITGIDKSRRYVVSTQTEEDTSEPKGLGDEDKRSLWLIDLGTKKETRLTNIKNHAEGDSFSPDGEWIVFMMTVEGEKQPDIYKIKKDGTELTKLTDTKTVTEGDPEFSHDGKKIVFTSIDGLDPNPRFVIKMMDSSGQNIQTVFDGGKGVAVGPFPQGNYDPSWSPDDDWIVFERAKGNTGGNWRSGIWHIFKVKRDGSGLVDLSERGNHKDAAEYLPSFSPDGKSIIFGSLFFNALKPEQSYNSVFLMNADNGFAKRLTIDSHGIGDMYPVFIPALSSTSSITVLSPNGGEKFVPGQTMQINWSQQKIANVTIYLMKTQSFRQSVIAYNRAVDINSSTGSYLYTIPADALPADTYKIWITDYQTGASDWSDAPFSIVNATTI